MCRAANALQAGRLNWLSSALIEADLQQLSSRWSDLPQAIRSAIVAVRWLHTIKARHGIRTHNPLRAPDFELRTELSAIVRRLDSQMAVKTRQRFWPLLG